MFVSASQTNYLEILCKRSNISAAMGSLHTIFVTMGRDLNKLLIYFINIIKLNLKYTSVCNGYSKGFYSLKHCLTNYYH